MVAPYVEVQAPWKGRGAGTVIEVDGEVLILTAAHVVEGYNEVPQQTPFTGRDGKPAGKPGMTIQHPKVHKKGIGLDADELTRSCEVVWYTAPEEKGGNDLALLKPTSPEGLKKARLHTRHDLRTGEQTWYIGTPAGEHGRLERSIVAIHDRRMFDRAWTGTNGCGWYGNSGGGLYVERDGHYVLAGVVTRKTVDGNPANLILAKTPDQVRDFLESYKRNKAEPEKPEQQFKLPDFFWGTWKGVKQ